MSNFHHELSTFDSAPAPSARGVAEGAHRAPTGRTSSRGVSRHQPGKLDVELKLVKSHIPKAAHKTVETMFYQKKELEAEIAVLTTRLELAQHD